MKYRALTLLPVVLAIALLGASLALGERMTCVLRYGNEIGKTLAVVGALAAALAFERGEYLNRAWLTYGGCYMLLLVNDSLGAMSAPSHWFVLRGAVVALANTSQVVGTWMLARAWTVAGLSDEAEDRTRRRALAGGATLLALAMTGLPLVRNVRALLAGDAVALIHIASDLGDTFTLALAAPVMLTALAMRGGLLRWPWGLLTASGLAWIAYDATSNMLHTHHVGPGLGLAASESVRALANGWVLAAGFAQRMAVAPNERPSHPLIE